MNYRDQKFATSKILTTAILNKLTRCPIQFAIFKKFLSFLYLCLKCFIHIWYSKNKFVYYKICRTPCICFILIVGMTPPNQIHAHRCSLLEKCSIFIYHSQITTYAKEQKQCLCNCWGFGFNNC